MAKPKEETFKEKERYKGGHGALGPPARSTVSLKKISRKNRYRVPNILMGFCLPFPVATSKDHRLGGSTQETFTVSQLWRLEAPN